MYSILKLQTFEPEYSIQFVGCFYDGIPITKKYGMTSPAVRELPDDQYSWWWIALPLSDKWSRGPNYIMSNFAYTKTHDDSICVVVASEAAATSSQMCFLTCQTVLEQRCTIISTLIFFLSSGHIILHTVEIAVSLRQNPALMFRQARKLKKLWSIVSTTCIVNITNHCHHRWARPKPKRLVAMLDIVLHN